MNLNITYLNRQKHVHSIIRKNLAHPFFLQLCSSQRQHFVRLMRVRQVAWARPTLRRWAGWKVPCVELVPLVPWVCCRSSGGGGGANVVVIWVVGCWSSGGRTKGAGGGGGSLLVGAVGWGSAGWVVVVGGGAGEASSPSRLEIWTSGMLFIRRLLGAMGLPCGQRAPWLVTVTAFIGNAFSRHLC